MRTTDETTRTWIRAGAIAAVAGGGCWGAKQLVIAASLPATGGPPPESLPIAVFYLAGAALMVIGASGVVARLTVGWSTALRVLAAVVLAPMIFFAVSQLADSVVDAIAGPDAGWWWPGEGGILLTGLLFASAGAAALVSARKRLVTSGS